MRTDGVDEPTPPNLFLIMLTSIVNLLLLVVILRAVLAGLPVGLALLMLLFVLASSLAIAAMLWRYQPSSASAE